MDLPRRRGQQHLSRLHADIHALDAAKAQIASWPVQHDCAAGVHHMRLKEHFVDVAVVVDNVEFGGGKMESPVAEVAIYNVDGMVFKGGIEARAFEDLAKVADGIDEVGEGAKDGQGG